MVYAEWGDVLNPDQTLFFLSAELMLWTLQTISLSQCLLVLFLLFLSYEPEQGVLSLVPNKCHGPQVFNRPNDWMWGVCVLPNGDITLTGSVSASFMTTSLKHHFFFFRSFPPMRAWCQLWFCLHCFHWSWEGPLPFAILISCICNALWIISSRSKEVVQESMQDGGENNSCAVSCSARPD